MKSELSGNAQNANFPVRASRIREARRYIGYKMEDAANFLGVSKDEYSKLEMNGSIMNRKKLEKLAKLYYRPFHFFIRNESAPERNSGISSIDNLSLPQQDIKEILKFAEFLSSVPKKQLMNGNQFNYRKLFSQTQSGEKTAIELLRKLELAQDYSIRNQVDVLQAIRKMGLLLLFRPMKNLMGTTVIRGDTVGIILNSKLPLESQRYAAACELGRNLLTPSSNRVDDQMFIHIQLEKFHKKSELEGEAREIFEFASNFLLPKELIHMLIRKQGWSKKALSEPENVYQASLRFGVSYENTIYGLEREKLISGIQRERLLKNRLKSVKRKLACIGKPDISWDSANFWHLTENDNGTAISVELNDILLFDFVESPSTGFVWNFNELDGSVFSILDDKCISNVNTTDGPPIRRRVVAKANKKSTLQELQIQRKQPWKDGELGETLNFQYQCVPC